jgi:DNA polymerase elongation subunit (family B)
MQLTERNPIFFDIETGPLSGDEIRQYMPKFDAPSNYKDEEKIAKAIAEKESAWLEKAALSPITGKVLAIGYCINDKDVLVLEGDEKEILTQFWDAITHYGAILRKLIGFNSNSFDLPFLIRRSWKLGVHIPNTLYKYYRGRVYLNENCVDILDYWSLDTRDSIKLTDLGKYLGVGEKTGSGAMFASLYAENRDEAISYLKNDILLTYKCAYALQIVNF